MLKSVSRLLPVFVLCILFVASSAQPPAKTEKPYKIVSAGRQITIKSSRIINQVMLWTTSGNRVVEQKGINNTSWVLNIPVNQKSFFLMIALNDGKVYTEKIH